MTQAFLRASAAFLFMPVRDMQNRPRDGRALKILCASGWVGVHLFLFCAAAGPHSAMYFNPVLDRIFKANVFHQLHHATSRGYYRFVPWAHVLPARRRADCARYNEVFDADFEFR